jgi:hypothetical protein
MSSQHNAGWNECLVGNSAMMPLVDPVCKSYASVSNRSFSDVADNKADLWSTRMNATMYTSGVDEHEYDDIDWILAMLGHKADFESSHQITTLSIPSMGESCSAVTSKSLSIYDADEYEPIRRCPESTGGVKRPPRRFFRHLWRNLVLKAVYKPRNQTKSVAYNRDV